MNWKLSAQFCSFYLGKLSVDHSCPCKVIIMQSESVAKMSFSGIWQASAVFVGSSTQCVVSRVLHSLSSCGKTVFAMLFLFHKHGASSQLMHRDARELEFLQHCSLLENTMF